MRRTIFAFIALLAPVFAQAPAPAPAATAAPAIPSYKQLKYPPLKAPQIPQPAVVTLANGMKVYLLENHELPLVSGNALVRTGNLFDPPDKRGLADFTGQVMRSGGTKSKTGDAIDVELENIAASVESQIGESSGSVSFGCLRENTDQVLAIFKDVLTNPEFRQDKLDLAVQQEKSSISRRNDDPGGIAGREFANTVYGKDNPYGWSIEYEHINRIKRDDLIAFYKRYFFPKNVRLAVYGDFKTDEMKAKLEKLFGDWTVDQPPVPPFPKLEVKARPGVYLAEKDDTTQTFFEIGHFGGLLRDKDYPALQVAGNILGSGFSSRLMSMVRTKLGYAYNIGGGWGAGFDHPGIFQISGSTKSSTTTDTIRVVREEVEKLRNAPVTDAELQTAKDGVLNSFVFNFDRPSKTLNRLILYEYFDYPKDFIFQYQKAISAVTKADVQRVAKEYWKPENFTIVAVGNPKEFGKPLDELKIPVQKIDLTIPEPKPEAAASAKPADAASLAKGKEIAAKAMRALGGDPIAQMKDIEAARELELQTGAATLKIRQTTRIVYPNHLRQDQQLPFGKISVYSDAKTGWMIGPQGPMPIQSAVIQQARGEVFRSFTALLAPTNQFNAVSETTVEISDAEGGNRAKLEISADGLPKKLTYLSTTMAGPASEVTETYSDWREVSGLRLPHRILIEQGGKRYAEITVSGYKVNTGAKAEDLAKKP